MTPGEFRRIARRALRLLPAEFQPYVKDCLLAVKRRASAKRLREMEMPEDEELYGVYEGASLTERRSDDEGELPPRIILFYEPLIEDFPDETELEHEIQVTVLHELGHHFGLDEKRLEELGYE